MMEDEHKQSCMVLQSVCSSIETLLGPNKSLKCYISSDDDADSAILGDTMQVLDALMDSHHHPPPTTTPTRHHPPPPPPPPPPALHLLYECCQQHHKRFGCGVTTLICLAGYWATEILPLTQLGIPLPVVLALFREALGICRTLQLKTLLPKVNHHLQRKDVGGERMVKNDGGERRVKGVKDYASRAKCDVKGHISTGHVTDHVTGVHPNCANRVHANLSKKQAKVFSFSRHFSRHANQLSDNGVVNVDGGVVNAETDSKELDQLVSTMLAHGDPLAMKLALEARQQQLSARLTQAPTPPTPPGAYHNMSIPLQYFLVGKPASHSKIVRGVVSDLHLGMLSVAQSLTTEFEREWGLLVIDGDCTSNTRHLGFQGRTGHMISHDTSQLYEESQLSQWLTSCISSLEKFEVGILVVGGTVCSSLWEHCIGAGVLILQGIPADQRKVIAAIFGATQLSYLIQANQHVIGKDVCIEVMESGWHIPRGVGVATRDRTSTNGKRKHPVRTYCCRLFRKSRSSLIHISPSPASPLSSSSSSSSPSPPVVVTALLCGLSEYFVDNLRHKFINSYHRLRLTLDDKPTSGLTREGTPHPRHCYHVLPGGGQTEAACIFALERKSTTNGGNHDQTSYNTLPLYFTHSWVSDPGLLQESGWRSSIYQAFASGLRRYVAQVVLNCKSSHDLLSTMEIVERMVAAQQEESLSGDLCIGEGILDVAVSKWQAWSSAVQLLETIFLCKRISTQFQN